MRWPSGLRRQTKDLVRKGVGSNPTLIMFLLLFMRDILSIPKFQDIYKDWQRLIKVFNQPIFKVRWPSGLRRQTKDLVRKGVGSNPTLIKDVLFLLFVSGAVDTESPSTSIVYFARITWLARRAEHGTIYIFSKLML